MNEHYDIRRRPAHPRRRPAPCPAGVRLPAPTVNEPTAVPTAPVAARRPLPRRAVVAVVAVVAVTLIRPWGDATSSPAPATRVSDASELALLPTPTPEPAPSLLPDEIACPPSGWQVVSLDRLGTWTVRSWVPADIVAASGPLDPRVRRMTLESPEVLAIGACAPPTVAGDGAAPARWARPAAPGLAPRRRSRDAGHAGRAPAGTHPDGGDALPGGGRAARRRRTRTLARRHLRAGARDARRGCRHDGGP
jgi:hypothetical protein